MDCLFLSRSSQKWKKFGDAVNDGEGINPSTTQTAEEVFLTLTTNKEVRGRYM